LLEKLKIFPDEIIARERVATRYSARLSDVAIIPVVMEGCTSVWAHYTIRVAQGRDQLAATLRNAGVPTEIYYPKALHQQAAYKKYPIAGNGLPASERLVGEVLSLPIHAYLTEDAQNRIIEVLRNALSTRA
jgi:dTDP-4-amino-4,6-dideoxygalactose transaminase